MICYEPCHALAGFTVSFALKMVTSMAEETIKDVNSPNYDEGNIRTLSGLEHIRHRPGMYIGNLGGGLSPDDGIYVLLKEVIDNSIDEFKMNAGNVIEVIVEDNLRISVRDYGRGIPQGKLIESVSQVNTSGKFDSDKSTSAFEKSIGMNGVGIKATNALSSRFVVSSYRDGKVRTAIFERGILKSDVTGPTDQKNGTFIFFEPDDTKFLDYSFRDDILQTMMQFYSYVNTGLTILLNGQPIISRHGLEDLIQEKLPSTALYPIISLKGDDISIAFTHTDQNNEEYYSFANGQYTYYGGTHQNAFRECVARAIRDYFGKYEYVDIRAGMVAAIAINIENPIFQAQTKGKLNSNTISPDGETINKFIGDFLGKELDNYLHKYLDVAQIIEKKIKENERERIELAGATKATRERLKRAVIHNIKLQDCRVHYCDHKNKLRYESCIFITEGESASGSITKIRDVNTQAVFALKGKTLNTYGKSKREVFENAEINMLQAALGIEGGINKLRYNKVIVATDADDDGMHIRLLLITFFLQFYPELIRQGHVYVLQTPLFRVRNKISRLINKRVITEYHSNNGKNKEFITRYCYTDEERQKAIIELGPGPEITRFKGLGEISPDEFKAFIGPGMRLDQLTINQGEDIESMLKFFMGKNTMERQKFIIENLVVEEDAPLD